MLKQPPRNMPSLVWALVMSGSILSGFFIQSAKAASSPMEEASPQISVGRNLFLRHCAPCHGQDARGGGRDNSKEFAQTPPDLTRPELWNTYGIEELAVKVLVGIPLQLTGTARKNLGRNVDEIDSFLRRLATTDRVHAKAGSEIYANRCLPCHDSNGRPRNERPPGVAQMPRNLSDPAFQASINDRDLKEILRHGRRGMPGLVPRVTEAEAEQLVTWVRLLSPGHVHYKKLCASCHGDFGEGTESSLVRDPNRPTPSFDAIFFKQRSAREVRSAITHMLREQNSTMPHLTRALTINQVRFILEDLQARISPAKPAQEPATDS